MRQHLLAQGMASVAMMEDMKEQMLSGANLMDFAQRSAHRPPPSVQQLRRRLLPPPPARLRTVQGVR
jgi:hypothetical protein